MSFPPPETAPCSLSSEQPGLDKSRHCFVHQRKPTDANLPYRQPAITCIPDTATCELRIISTATTRLYMCISKGTLINLSESDLCLDSDKMLIAIA